LKRRKRSASTEVREKGGRLRLLLLYHKGRKEKGKKRKAFRQEKKGERGISSRFLYGKKKKGGKRAPSNFARE